MSISEKLNVQNERLVAIKDELFILKELMDNTEESLSEDQVDSIHTLSEEQDSVIKRIEALEKIEQGLAAKAVPVQKTAATGGASPHPPHPHPSSASRLRDRTPLAPAVHQQTAPGPLCRASPAGQATPGRPQGKRWGAEVPTIGAE